MSEFGEGTTFDLFPKVMPHVISNLTISLTLKRDLYVLLLEIFVVVYGIFSIYCVYKVTDKKEYENIEFTSRM